jgi:hypothetical protein
MDRAEACLNAAAPDLLAVAEEAITFALGICDVAVRKLGGDDAVAQSMITEWQAVVAKAKGEVQ